MIITDEVTFNNIYTLSKDPVLQAVLAIPATSPARGQAAYNAAYAGEIVDADIMASGYSPFKTMEWRESEGYLWTPSALMDAGSLIASGALKTLPIQPGGIKTSRDDGDYPPFAQPGPKYDPSIPWVGQYITQQCWGPTPAAEAWQRTATPIPTGFKIEEQGHIFVALVMSYNVNDLRWILQP